MADENKLRRHLLMADYQIRARIPQELAEEVKGIVERVNNEIPFADATISSVTRQALQEFVNRNTHRRKPNVN